MLQEIKILREFLCNHNASEVTHLALDQIVHHLRMLPEERTKRDFVVGDWVRIVGPELQSVISRVLGFREDYRIVLVGLTGSFEPSPDGALVPAPRRRGVEQEIVRRRAHGRARRALSRLRLGHRLPKRQLHLGATRSRALLRSEALMARRCDFCERLYSGSADMCPRCAKSYDASRRADDGTIHAILIWAAKRARYFERLKHRKPSQPH